MTINQARIYFGDQLKDAGVPDYKVDTDILIMEVLSLTRERLFLDSDMHISTEKLEILENLFGKRKKRIPLQHILGTTSFMGFEFKVNEKVLIPRPETEILVENAIKYISQYHNNPVKILDMFTGSGCIAISIAKLLDDKVDVYASDISEDALSVAKENAKKLSVNIRFKQGDVYFAIPKDARFDIITANPPYIKTDDIASLEKEVKDYDPMTALSGGADGLCFYRKLAEGLESHLALDGRLITEIGFDQAGDVRSIFSKFGFDCEKVIKDYSDKDRVLVFCRR